MPSALSNAITRLRTSLESRESVQATFSHGGHSVTAAATLARTRLDLETAADVSIQHEMKDFILPAADLVLNGRVTRPQPGMRIACTLAGVAAVFEVANIPGGQCFSWMDHGETMMRIHTVKVR